VRGSFGAGARSVIYALLLSAEEPTRAGQLELLRQDRDAASLQQVDDFWPELQGLEPRAKLPLIDLALPACAILTRRLRQFSQMVQALVEYDRAIDLFEYACRRSCSAPAAVLRAGARLPRSFSSLKRSRMNVRSCCRRWRTLGKRMSRRRLRRSGAEPLSRRSEGPSAPGRRCAQPGPRGFCPRAARAALQREEERPARLRPDCATDAKVLDREAELLRAIAEALDCPSRLLLKLWQANRRPSRGRHSTAFGCGLLTLAREFLVTGGAGFIGSHVLRALAAFGHAVWAFDDLNAFYDPRLKQRNLRDLQALARPSSSCMVT